MLYIVCPAKVKNMEQTTIKSEEFRKIVSYVKDELLKQIAPMMHAANQYPTDAVAKAIVLSIPQLITLDGYLKYLPEPKTEEEYIDRITTAWLEKDMV
jgi:hypothetical protein